MKDMKKHQGAPDFAETAFSIFQQSTGETPIEEPKPEKNPAAVALGKLGGSKGGKARAANLTKEQMSEIAKKAAAKRWGKKT